MASHLPPLLLSTPTLKKNNVEIKISTLNFFAMVLFNIKVANKVNKLMHRLIVIIATGADPGTKVGGGWLD